MKTAQGGFSFIEMVIVIAIMGLMAAIVGPAMMKWLGTGRVTATEASLQGISQAIDSYYIDMGAYPQTLKNLITKPLDEEAGEDWRGPYLKIKKGKKNVPKDAWKKKFVYRLNPEGSETPFELYSYGEKGKGAKPSEWIRA